MTQPEVVYQLWGTLVLSTIQDILTHPFQPDGPPLSLATKYIGEGLTLSRAVAKSVSVEGKALEAVCLGKAPQFPKDLIGRMFSYASAHIDLAERLVGGTNPEDLVAEQTRKAAQLGQVAEETKIAAFRVVLDKLRVVQSQDRSGFKLVDVFSSPISLTALRNSEQYPDIAGRLIILSGQRYKAVYQTMQLG